MRSGTFFLWLAFALAASDGSAFAAQADPDGAADAQSPPPAAVPMSPVPPPPWYPGSPNPPPPCYRCSDSDFVSRALPAYPTEAMCRNQTGTVVLLVHVDEQGSPSGVVVEKSSHVASLDASALEAAKSWRFRPRRDEQGNATPGIVRVPVDFTLSGGWIPACTVYDELGLARDASPAVPIEGAATFGPNEPVLVQVWMAREEGTEVEVAWQLAGADPQPGAASEHVERFRVGAPSVRRNVRFLPRRGWRAGHYQVAVSVLGQVVHTLRFDVK